MEEKFSTFEIKHTLRSENRYADALVALGSQIVFEGSSTRIEVSKEDWRILIKEALIKEEHMAELKALKDYALVKGELYRRMLGGILSRCVGQEEA